MEPGQIVISIIGYLGAVGIAIFSFPEVINVLKNKKTSHLSKTSVILFSLLLCSSLCFVISGIYNVNKDADKLAQGDSATSFNLAVTIANFFSCSAPCIILSYKLFRRNVAKQQGLTELELEQKEKKNKK